MKCVDPEIQPNATLVVFGSDQAEHYFPLPASVDSQGTVMTEWEPSAEDLACLLRGGRLRFWILYTGIIRGEKMTPLKVETIDAPEEKESDEDAGRIHPTGTD